jgi:hypothetical protein
MLTEVKSSTMTSRSSKKARKDVAFQVHVLGKAGVPVERVKVMHLNPEYVHPDYEKLLSTRQKLAGGDKCL